MYNKCVRLTTILGLLLSADTVGAGEILVPCDQSTIQGGINAAVAGDVVIVDPGSYNESIDFGGKAITVRSIDPDDPAVVMATVINALGFLHAVIFDDGEGADSVLKGFVITGGNATAAIPHDRGGGAFIISASPTIENCTFTANHAFSGNGAISAGACLNETSTATYENVQFCNNIATNLGGAVYNFLGDTSTLIRCTISRNSADVNGGGMFNDNSSPALSSTGFCGNQPNAFAGINIIDNGGNSLLYCAPPAAPPSSCPADLDENGTVEVIDLLALLAAWGACS